MECSVRTAHIKAFSRFKIDYPGILADRPEVLRFRPPVKQFTVPGTGVGRYVVGIFRSFLVRVFSDLIDSKQFCHGDAAALGYQPGCHPAVPYMYYITLGLSAGLFVSS